MLRTSATPGSAPQRLELRGEDGLERRDARDQSLALDDVEVRVGGGAGDGVAHVGQAVAERRRALAPEGFPDPS